MHGVLDAEEEEWKLETACRIGEVMAEQGRYNEAASWHRRVMEQRLGQSPLNVEKAAAAAVQCLRCHQQQESTFTVVDNTIINDLDRIWKERPQNNESYDIPTCGHELGVRLLALGRDEEAVALLLPVWERRKLFGEALGQESLASALSLVDLSVKTGNLSRLETLYHWIITNPTAGQSETDQLWFRYRLGCVQAILEKWAIAENNLRKVLDRQTELFGAEDADSLQYTQVLAEVIKRQGRLADAKTLVRNIWESRSRHPRSVLQAILRIGHLYGDIIMESNAPAELAKAETVSNFCCRLFLPLAMSREQFFVRALETCSRCS